MSEHPEASKIPKIPADPYMTKAKTFFASSLSPTASANLSFTPCRLLLIMRFAEKAGAFVARVASRRGNRPVNTIGLAYKFFCVLAKLLPAKLLYFLVGIIYAR